MYSILLAVILTCLTCVTAAATEVYRSTDEGGNPTFSDKPQPGSEQIEVQPANIQSLPPVRALPTKRQTVPSSADRYQSLKIVSPANDATLRNSTELTLNAAVSPVLLGQHTLIFLDSGKPIGDPGRSLSMQVRELERGSHLFQVKIVDAQGKALMTSETVAVHVHRPNLLRRKSP